MKPATSDDVTTLTAVGRSTDGFVRAKVNATGYPIGFKLAAEHPAMEPETTLALALQALRDAHAKLENRARDHAERDLDGRGDGTAHQVAETAVADNARTLAELERYAGGVRAELERAMTRLSGFMS